MRIITKYVAYDDTEFDTVKECYDYEKSAREFVKEANDVYLFLNKNMDILYPPRDEMVEHWLVWFEAIVDACEYIQVRETPSRELHQFLYHNIGCIAPEVIGTYKYNWHINEWVRTN